MKTEREMRKKNGFTLIEVMVAMVILSVGLLGLQALAIVAAKSTAQAGHRTEMASAATGALEAQTRAIHTAGAVSAQAQQCASDAVEPLVVCTTIQTAGLPPSAGRIEVEVRRTTGNLDPYTVSSYVFIPPSSP